MTVALARTGLQVPSVIVLGIAPTPPLQVHPGFTVTEFIYDIYLYGIPSCKRARQPANLTAKTALVSSTHGARVV